MKALLCLLLVMILASVQGFRRGFGGYLFLGLGALLAFVCLFFYASLGLGIARTKKKTWLAPVVALCGFVPYLFGCYLCLYEGFWGLKALWGAFSILVFLKAIFFIVIGFLIVNGTYLASELIRKVDEQVRME